MYVCVRGLNPLELELEMVVSHHVIYTLLELQLLGNFP